eukprot:6211748-Pleurochrysis_carterae.AAC.4
MIYSFTAATSTSVSEHALLCTGRCRVARSPARVSSRSWPVVRAKQGVCKLTQLRRGAASVCHARLRCAGPPNRDL